MRNSTLACVVLAGGVLVAAPVEVRAQSPRANRFLFGGSSGSGDSGQALTLTSNFSSGYDNNAMGGTRQVSTPGFSSPQGASGSTFQQGGGALAYDFTRTRFQFGVSGGGATAYYPSLQTWAAASGRASVAGSVNITNRLRLSGSGSASSTPSYLLFGSTVPPVFGGGPAPPPMVDQTLGNGNLNTIGSTLVLGYDLARRVTFSSNYFRSRSRSTSDSRDLWSQTAGAGLRFSLSKGLGLRLGYSRQLAHSSDPVNRPHGRNDSIEVGIDFSKPLSLSRKTTLSFSTGISGIGYGDRQEYRFTGSARLLREIGRSWSAGLNYRRNAQFIETFGAPVSSDGVSAGINGLISRRLNFTAGLGTAKGQVGLSQLPSSDYVTLFGSTSLTSALTRYLAVGVDYSTYRDRIGSGVTLPTGVSSELSRQTVRVFVTMNAPLFQRSRRPDATR